ncbi:MAG: glycosyltransferase [Ferruginibacter sp.]|nr:glycosyltransferase [Ferruginibacter sp.]
MEILVILVVVLYTTSLLFIFLYSITQVDLLFTYLFHKKKYRAAQQPLQHFVSLPIVTVQLPVFNEKYVVQRLIDCVADLDYPTDKLEIQVLDDSTDETVQIIADKVAQLKGIINIRHIRRANRSGYKAGALKEGLATAGGELVAIFDADFLPAKNFLQKTVPHFMDAQVGMVQTKWAWINKSYSMLTKVQAFALDAHFSIEQVGRNINNGFINFNGTAGVWRKSCILDAGNWQADTLTEDLDLSYRAQLKDWKFVYLEEVGSPSELPPVMSAVKTQQYRWNKGGAETARKHLWKVISAHKPLLVKWHAIMHLLTSGIFLSALTCAICSVPILLIKQFYPAFTHLFTLANYCFAGFLILGATYLLTATIQNKNKWNGVWVFCQTMPAFLLLSLGLSLHNGIAVLEGYAGKRTPFVRTPKFNMTGQENTWFENQYINNGTNRLTIAETLMMLYFSGGVFLAFQLNDFTILPFHILLISGYGLVVYYSIKG